VTLIKPKHKLHVVPEIKDGKTKQEKLRNLLKLKQSNKSSDDSLLKEVEAIIPKIARLPGVDGSAKMSKTLGNAVYLSDSIDEVSKKIKKMYTDPNHLRIEDPGQVEGNPVFIYLDAFGTDLEKIQELKEHYSRGGLGDSVVKKYLLEILVEFLEPIQKRRQLYENNLDEVKRILHNGILKAQERAESTLKKAKEAMFLNY
jgi:tryptophanyl-tRNA synthetase